MVHLCGTPARPRHSVVITICRTTICLQRSPVEGVLVFHVQLDALRRLTGVPDGPHTFVELARDAFNVGCVFVFHLDVAEETIGPAKLVSEQPHDLVVRLALKERCHNLIAPLEGAVGSGHRPTGLKLGTGRQQVNAVSAVMKYGGNRWIRVNNNQHVQLFHRSLHLATTGLRVWRVAPKHHGPHFVRVVHVLWIFQNTIDPARHRNTGEVLKRLLLAIGTCGFGKLAIQPFAIFFPHATPVRPSAFGQAVVAWQGVAQNAKVGGALYVVVTTEDVGTTTFGTHVAKGQLQNAVRTGVVVTIGVLCATHTPDHGAWTIVHQLSSHTTQLLTRSTGNAFNFFWVPAAHFVTDLVHAPNTGADELFVFPTVFEDVP
mmetsp:Transcript_16872/g.21792  ORF Transcript_16872/g.21792 Transcript_16872/m.21792 type:complete len:374 (+) Transcript_16872:1501-2622(+)